MNISWVLSNDLQLDPTQDVAQLKKIGPLWGSWTTWRACQTDNVICNDAKKAEDLVKRAFHSVCNFYVSDSTYALLQQPQGVKIYQGQFVHDVDRQDEIVAMHLAGSTSDIVLMLGFDFGEHAPLPDRLQQHRAQNYQGLTKQAIVGTPNTQWVMVGHAGPLRRDLLTLSNLTTDSLENVIGMLSN